MNFLPRVVWNIVTFYLRFFLSPFYAWYSKSPRWQDGIVNEWKQSTAFFADAELLS